MDSGNLKGLFGGGDDSPDAPNQRAKAQDFVQRYTTGDPTEGYSEDEARSAFETVAQRASPETMQRAARETLNKLNPDQRSQFAEMLKQRQAGQGGVQIERAGGSAGGGGGIDDMLGGLLGGGGGGGLGGLLGGLLGGGQGGGRSGGGLDDLLGGLGGGQPRSQTGFEQRGGDEGGGGMFGGLGDLMGSPVGKAVIGGIAAFSLKEMMDKK